MSEPGFIRLKIVRVALYDRSGYFPAKGNITYVFVTPEDEVTQP